MMNVYHKNLKKTVPIRVMYYIVKITLVTNLNDLLVKTKLISV